MIKTTGNAFNLPSDTNDSTNQVVRLSGVVSLFGTKMGMTRMFDQGKSMIPITLIKASAMTVLETKVLHGYNLVVVGVDKCREEDINQPMVGQFKKYGFGFFKRIETVRVPSSMMIEKGTEIPLDSGYSCIYEGAIVDVTGISLGKGFAGVMKRHGFKGASRDTHGTSLSHRAQGSTGAGRSFPGKVFKGKKMPGHMGCDRVTVQNLKVVFVAPDKSYFAVQGCIPGADSGRIKAMRAVKSRGRIS